MGEIFMCFEIICIRHISSHSTSLKSFDIMRIRQFSSHTISLKRTGIMRIRHFRAIDVVFLLPDRAPRYRLYQTDGKDFWAVHPMLQRHLYSLWDFATQTVHDLTTWWIQWSPKNLSPIWTVTKICHHYCYGPEKSPALKDLEVKLILSLLRQPFFDFSFSLTRLIECKIQFQTHKLYITLNLNTPNILKLIFQHL